MTTQTHPIESRITPELANDLFTPSVPILDLCRRHGVALPDLVAIMETDWFRENADALDRAEQLRSAALAPDRRERALTTLDAITSQESTTPSHTECIRRAATAMLKATTPNEPRASARAAPQDPTPPNDPTPTDPNTNETTPNLPPPQRGEMSRPSVTEGGLQEPTAPGAAPIVPDTHDPTPPNPQPPEPQTPLRNLRDLRVENSESPSPSASSA